MLCGQPAAHSSLARRGLFKTGAFHGAAQPSATLFHFPKLGLQADFDELPSNHLLILCVFCSCKEVLCQSSCRHSKRKQLRSNGNRTSSRTWNKNGRSWLRTPSSCPTGRSSRDWTQRTRTIGQTVRTSVCIIGFPDTRA